MRTTLILVLSLLVTGMSIIQGCGDPVEKNVVGVWFIEDIGISGDTLGMDTERYRSSLEGQKNLRFELKEDSIISIYTGSSEITGIWYYDKSSKGIFVTLEGNMYPTPLGKYVGGKLINSDTNNVGIIINTVFRKVESREE